MPKPAAALAALLLALPAGARAADCPGLGPAGTASALYEVEGRGRPVPLLRNGPGCPADTPACRSPTTLPSGNRVLVTGTEGAWSCATHADARGTVSTGWVATSTLTPVPDLPSMRPSDWAGRWRSGDRAIRLTAARDGSVTLRAEAGARGGRLATQFAPEGTEVAFVLAADGTTRPDAPEEATLCRMVLGRRGPYLIVQDNGRCGAPGFTGPYRKR